MLKKSDYRTVKNWYFNEQHELLGTIYGDNYLRDGMAVRISLIEYIVEYPDYYLVRSTSRIRYILLKDTKLKGAVPNIGKFVR